MCSRSDRKLLPFPHHLENKTIQLFRHFSALPRSLLSANYTEENTRGGRPDQRGAHFHLTKKLEKVQMKRQSYMTHPVSQVIYD
jgi:hypothetical protein